MPYLPGLDGMRALAVIAVMIFHADHDWLPAGFLGVEVFFVISGYLITLLLIAEHERDGEVSLGAFWGRRFRRLLPALYLTLVGIVVYCALFKRDQLGQLRGDVVGAVFYVSNWFQIWSGQGYGAGTAFVPLRHLWSLAVEEQFYLIWPLVMIWLLRRGRERLPQVGMWLIAIAFIIAAATSLLFHLGTVSGFESTPGAYSEIFGRQIDTNNLLYLSTISRSSGILLGAGFAMLWRPLAMMRGPMRDKGRTMDIIAIVALLGLAGQMLVYELIGSTSASYYPPLFNGGLLLTGVLTVALIAAVTHSGSIVGKFLGNRVLNWVGTRSYGLYLFHWPIYQIIRREAGVALTVPKFVLALLLTGLVTEASYRLLETPVRKREFFARFRPATPQVLLGLGAFGLLFGYGAISLANSEVRCATKIQCDSEAANSIRDEANTTSTASTEASVAATTVPGQTTLPATTTTAVRQVIPLVAIGESVMQGAAAALADNGAVVDAQESRGVNKVLDLVTAYAQNNDVQVMVIQAGTNGRVTQDEYDKIAAAAAPVQQVFFMTVKAPLDYIAGNNAIIRGLPASYPNIQIIDWETQGATIESELSKGDGGIHLNSATAVRFYANLILAAAGKPLIADPNATGSS
ncbi:MAG: acyltransferase family protein [Ilumatobacteraceae bacterium]